MSLKCSILGHRFDETAVERDREEDGSEVVTTITELETCSRCGETRVVSENKEVTTMETPADVDAGTGDAAAGTPDDGTSDADAAEDDAAVVESGDAAGGSEESGVAASTGDPGGEPGTGNAIEGDDAEILDSGSGADDSETDAQSRTRESPESTPVPDAEAGEAGPADAGDGETDDAVIIDGDTGDERDPGEWPETDAGESVAGGGESTRARESPESTAADGDDAPDWPEEDDASADPVIDEWPEETTRDAPDPEEGPPLEPSASPTTTVPEGMYRCSECGFTTEVESSSLRAGDFCPGCHRGTLVQHEDTE
ncbi:MAG: hypothetical protein V5A28_05695 [Haloarculaceae archaeon]